MKKFFWAIGLCVTTILVWFAASRGFYLHAAQVRSGEILALTALEQHKSYDVEGKLHETLPVIRAIKSDGSNVKVNQFHAPDGKPAENRMIIDLPNSRRVAVMDLSRSITTYRISSAQRAAFVKKIIYNDACKSPGSATQTLLGFEVRQLTEERPG